ncbi:MAG: hypothetical protein IKQ27_12035 [Lachnospiraceae bacterium]|nr:hypothetical protein [Lachnospiraceae bacterium]
MKRIVRIAGYVFMIILLLTGGAVFLYSDLVRPIQHKYPLGLGACLAALVLAWLLANADKRNASKSVFLYVVLLASVWIVLSFIL